MLGVRPAGLHQRIGLIFGSREEVERIERYHHEPVPLVSDDNPLFGTRSLFRN
jgi:fructose-1,6-bisphosphatase I/sedoheptulose-1,7-bisphosphatase